MEFGFFRGDWELLERRNNYNLLKHRTTAKLCEQYTINNITEQEVSLWGKRLAIQHQNVLSVLGCEVFSSLAVQKQFTQKSMRVYLESTIQRLSQHRTITRDDEVNLLLPALRGFERLFNEFGGFKVYPSLIAMTIERQIKVWKVPNFLQNITDQSYVSEQDMVLSILGIFKRILPVGTQIKSFKQALAFASNLKGSYVPRRKPISDLLSFSQKTQPQFQVRSSYDTQSNKIGCFKKQKPDLAHTIRDTLKMSSIGIQSDPHRKTSKNVSQLLPTTRNRDIRKQLFSPTKTLESKLAMIDQFLQTDRESSNSRLCHLFKYAVQYDTEMFQQLDRVKGKIVDIVDIKMLQRIAQVIDRSGNSMTQSTIVRKTRSPRVSLIEIQKIKRKAIDDYKVQTGTMKHESYQQTPKLLSKDERILQAKSMKSEVEMLLFD